MTTITIFSFNLNGLTLSTESNTYQFCPKSACSLFEDLKMIEGFDIDKNGEPVVLFQDENAPKGYDGEMWCDFVATFYINRRMAEIMAEHLQDSAAFRKTEAKIISLLPKYAA